MTNNGFSAFQNRFGQQVSEAMSLESYLNLCKEDRSVYRTAAERMVTALRPPKIRDTSTDPRLGRIFLNREIRTYEEAFPGFFGMEEVIQRIADFFQHAAQGLEESKQILYLLGPVGGGKSSLAERLKKLMEREPIYVLAVNRNGRLEESPIYESPLGLFNPEEDGWVEKEYGIPLRKLTGIASPWARKRLEEFRGDIGQFSVVRMYPSMHRQIAISKTEPGDENNQDISALVGKVDIRRLEQFSQADPDAYLYCGGLNRTTQGFFEFVEMFKAPIKVLHPLLTATQERNYVGTEGIGVMPYQGVIMAHSNEAEWDQFKNNKNNEAFLDRICVVKVPYCLRADEEAKIYGYHVQRTELAAASCAPWTYEMLAWFTVLSRLADSGSDPFTKLRVYNGEKLTDTDPKGKSVQEYRDAAAGVDEGMKGISTRFAFKVLSDTFTYDSGETAADPVHLMYVLEQHIRLERYPKELEEKYLDVIKSIIAPRFAEKIGKAIVAAYIENESEYGQNLFDRYIAYADAWIENQEFKDPDTGAMLKREDLDKELSKTEKPSNIANPKDFRNEVVKFTLRYRAAHGGENPRWRDFAKMAEVIEKRISVALDEMLPVISFGVKQDEKTAKNHQQFLARMVSAGYTERQVRRLVEWYSRLNKASA